MSSYKTNVIEKFALLTGAVVVIAHLSGPRSHAAFEGKAVFVHLDVAANMHLNAVHSIRTFSERRLPIMADAHGIAVDRLGPMHIRDGLSLDGLVATDPRPPTAAHAVGAIKRDAFDLLRDEQWVVTEINYLSNTPPAPNGQDAARDVILGHADRLVPPVTRLPQETLHGLIIAVDEKNDRITVQLMSNATEDFRVQDGLIFNAVHGGDQVEITIESINGAKTIVALRKE
jgi:hypothetical protein